MENSGASNFVPKASNALQPYFNTACFLGAELPTCSAVSACNDLNGPRNTSLDQAAFKEFELWESLKFQWRTDAFNSLNHPLPGETEHWLLQRHVWRGYIKGSSRTIQLSAKVLW